MARERRQKEIPGTERVTIPELDEAALEYAAARDTRIAAGVKEKDRLTTLVEVLKKHNVDTYVFDTEEGETMRVEKVPTKMKIKVRKVKDGEDDSDPEVEVDE